MRTGRAPEPNARWARLLAGAVGAVVGVTVFLFRLPGPVRALLLGGSIALAYARSWLHGRGHPLAFVTGLALAPAALVALALLGHRLDE